MCHFAPAERQDHKAYKYSFTLPRHGRGLNAVLGLGMTSAEDTRCRLGSVMLSRSDKYSTRGEYSARGELTSATSATLRRGTWVAEKSVGGLTRPTSLLELGARLCPFFRDPNIFKACSEGRSSWFDAGSSVLDTGFSCSPKFLFLMARFFLMAVASDLTSSRRDSFPLILSLCR